jgi:hypothetical protein
VLTINECGREVQSVDVLLDGQTEDSVENNGLSREEHLGTLRPSRILRV